MASEVDLLHQLQDSEYITLHDGSTRQIKRAIATVAASATDSAIVTAVTAKKIRVLTWFALCAGTATTLTFNSKPSGAGTAISPPLANNANGGESPPLMPAGWFETNSGEGLSASTGAGVSTGVIVIYIEV